MEGSHCPKCDSDSHTLRSDVVDDWFCAQCASWVRFDQTEVRLEENDRRRRDAAVAAKLIQAGEST